MEMHVLVQCWVKTDWGVEATFRLPQTRSQSGYPVCEQHFVCTVVHNTTTCNKSNVWQCVLCSWPCLQPEKTKAPFMRSTLHTKLLMGPFIAPHANTHGKPKHPHPTSSIITTAMISKSSNHTNVAGSNWMNTSSNKRKNKNIQVKQLYQYPHPHHHQPHPNPHPHPCPQIQARFNHHQNPVNQKFCTISHRTWTQRDPWHCVFYCDDRTSTGHCT